MTPPPPHDRPGAARIYIVDDHDLVRLGLITLISEQTDLVVCGQTDSFARALVEIPALNPDVALIDLSLKDGSGLELVRSLHRLQPALRICALSVHEETVYAQRLLRAGAAGYVMKGERPENLLSAIRRIAGGQKVVSDRVVATFLDPLTGRVDLHRSHELTDRELEVMELFGGGESAREIASRLHLTLKTVEHHRTKIRRKLNLASGADFIRFCVLWNKRKIDATDEAPDAPP